MTFDFIGQLQEEEPSAHNFIDDLNQQYPLPASLNDTSGVSQYLFGAEQIQSPERVQEYLNLTPDQLDKLSVSDQLKVSRTIQQHRETEMQKSFVHGMTLGASRLLDDQKGPKLLTEGQEKVMELVGSFAPIAGLLKGASAVQLPLANQFTKLGLSSFAATQASRAATIGYLGATASSLERTSRGEEVTPQTMIQDAASWYALDVGLEGIGRSASFLKDIFTIGKDTELGSAKALEFVKQYAKQTEGPLADAAADLSSAAKDGVEYSNIANEVARISFEPGRIIERSPGAGFRTSVVDQFYPIQQFVEGAELSTMEDPYKLAKLLQGWTGKADAFLNYKTFNAETLGWTGDGLNSILKPHQNELQDLSTYLVSKRGLELAKKRDIVTGINLEAAEKFVKDNTPRFESSAKKLQKYQDSLLSYAEDAGLISEETAQQLREMYPDYVPLQRVFQPEKVTGSGSSIRPKKVIHALKGSERDIIDPLESIVKNTYEIIRTSEQNKVLRALAKVAKEKTGMIKVMDEGLSMQGVKREPLKEINYFNNGKKDSFKVPTEVADAVNGLTQGSFSTLNKILSYPTRMIRTGATTLSPSFLVRAAVRDNLEAWMYSKNGFIPVYDWVRGLFKAFKKPELYWQFKASGADRSMSRAIDRSFANKTLSEVAGKTVKTPSQAFKAIEEFGEALERAPRLAEFERYLKRNGMSPEDLRNAAIAARDITIDFAVKGSKTRAMSLMTAFFNPAIQGADKFIQAVRADPATFIPKAVASFTLPTLALWYINKDDTRYQELPDYVKDKNWVIFTPLSDKPILISKPQELGAVFATLPERLAQYAYDKDPENIEKGLEAVLETFTPPLIPDIAKFPISVSSNKRIFSAGDLLKDGAPLVPEAKKKLSPQYQDTPYTTEAAKKIGSLVAKLPYIGETRMASPILIDEFITTWTGPVGKSLMHYADSTLGGKDNLRDSDIPVWSAFIGNKPEGQSKSLQRFYTTVNKLESDKATYDYLQKNGKHEEAEKLKEKSHFDQLKRGKAIRKIFNEKKKVILALKEDSNITDAEREILLDQHYADMVGLARSFNELNR